MQRPITAKQAKEMAIKAKQDLVDIGNNTIMTYLLDKIEKASKAGDRLLF